MFGKSKFNIEKLRTAAIKADLATTETSDAELEQIALTAIANSKTVVAEGPNDIDENIELEAETSEEKKAETTEKTDDTPSWFKLFVAKNDENLEKLATDIKAVAKKPQATGAAKGTEAVKSDDNKPSWAVQSRNAKLVAQLEAKGIDLNKYNPVTGKVEE